MDPTHLNEAVDRQLHDILKNLEKQLTERQVHDLREHLIAFQGRAEAVRSVPLSLHNEPALRFNPQG